MQDGGVEKIWALLVEACDELGAVQWEWQAADTAMRKARCGGEAIGPNPTDRAKNGTKHSLLTDGAGEPLAVVIAPANVHDTKLLEATLDAIVVEGPEPTPEHPQHLSFDKVYDNPTGRAATAKHKYVPHIRPIGEKPDKKQKRKYPARR